MRYIKGDLAQRAAKLNEGMDFLNNISKEEEKKLNDAVGKMLSKKKKKQGGSTILEKKGVGP